MRHLHHSPLLPLTRRLFRPSPPRLWRRVPWLSLLALLLLTALLSACSSPPALPTVDDSQRRPANSPAAIALQTCQSDLHNSRILASEQQRSKDIAIALAARQAAQQALQDRLTRIQTTAPAPNTVYVLRFAYGSTRLDWAPDQAQRLVTEAHDAPLVLLRGRTDGINNSPADLRLARDRAAASNTLNEYITRTSRGLPVAAHLHALARQRGQGSTGARCQQQPGKEPARMQCAGAAAKTAAGCAGQGGVGMRIESGVCIASRSWV